MDARCCLSLCESSGFPHRVEAVTPANPDTRYTLA